MTQCSRTMPPTLRQALPNSNTGLLACLVSYIHTGTNPNSSHAGLLRGLQASGGGSARWLQWDRLCLRSHQQWQDTHYHGEVATKSAAGPAWHHCSIVDPTLSAGYTTRPWLCAKNSRGRLPACGCSAGPRTSAGAVHHGDLQRGEAHCHDPVPPQYILCMTQAWYQRKLACSMMPVALRI